MLVMAMMISSVSFEKALLRHPSGREILKHRELRIDYSAKSSSAEGSEPKRKTSIKTWPNFSSSAECDAIDRSVPELYLRAMMISGVLRT